MSFHPETDDYKYWTTEEELKLQELTSQNKYSYVQIGKMLNRSGSSCQGHARAIGLKNKYIRRIYSLDQDFWAIPNETNCYWAGFSAADASIYKEKNTYKIELQASDKSHLEKLFFDCQYNGTIKNRIKKDSPYLGCRINITSPKWISDLESVFGIRQRKSNNVMPPSINNLNLLNKWLIGYIDGDGCIHVNKCNGSLMIRFVSCNPLLINWIKNYFDLFGSRVRKKDGGNVKNHKDRYFGYVVSGVKAAQFIDHVNSLNCYCLERKWRSPKVLQAVENLKLKFPDHFDKNNYFINFKNFNISNNSSLIPPPSLL